jgi:hypothetical protein
MTNPYAPPAVAAFVMPERPLPAGMSRHRLVPERAKALVREALLRRTLVTGILYVALIAVLMTMSRVANVVAVLVVVWVGTTAFTWVRVWRVASARLATFEIVASARVVRRVMAGVVTAEVLRPEVTRMVETRRALWILCDHPRRSVGVPRTAEQYAELRAALAGWGPIEKAGGVSAMLAPIRYARRGGPRDVVDGTWLASDPTLLDELRLVRAASADAGVGFGVPVPVRRWRRVLLLWFVLVFMFLALWQILQPGPLRPRSRPMRAAPVAT